MVFKLLLTLLAFFHMHDLGKNDGNRKDTAARGFGIRPLEASA